MGLKGIAGFSLLLQNQLTIQSPAAAGAKPGQPPQVQLPTTPHPNPMTPSPAQPSPAPSEQGAPPPPVLAMGASEGGSNDQEQAISAIMASLIKDSAQFEKEKSILQPQPPSTTPTLPPPLLSPSASGSSLSATAAMLPTCPVPPASLAGSTSVVKAVGTATAVAAPGSSSVSSVGGGGGGLKLVNRVSLQTLLSTPAIQQQPTVASPSPTKGGAPQLSAALSRPPVVSLPPTYTQALQAQQQLQQQQQPAAAANRPRIVQHPPQPHQQPSIVRRSLSGSEQPKPSLSQDAPGLQALLANAPSADSGSSNHESSCTAGPTTPSLLERLVTGQPVSSPAATPVRAISTQATSQIAANIVGQAPPTCADSTQEITLAAILAKPPSSAGSASSPSPTKASPLLQQLQQPVQQSPRMQQQQSIVSPLRQQQQPQLSPASSTRSQPSPRMIQPSPSPRPSGSFAMPPQSPKQQQQIMQPPGAQQQTSVRPQQPSILSATLQQQQQQQQPIMTLPVQDLVAVSQANGILNGGQQQQQSQQQQPQNVVSLQNLLQSGMVQVSTSNVTMQPGSSSTGNNMVLQIPGLADPVTLSVNMPPQQATLQQKQQMPPMVTTAVKFTAPQTVVLQQAGASGTSSFIQLPQQPTVGAALKQPTAVVSKAGQVLQVQHRQPPPPQQQQVFVNLQPGQQVVGAAAANSGSSHGQGQPIQIVRTVRGAGIPQQGGGTTMQLQLKSSQQQQGDHSQGQQQLPPPIQSPSPSGSSLTSPPDGSTAAAAVVLADTQSKNGNLGKVRQQRKQSLK